MRYGPWPRSGRLLRLPGAGHCHGAPLPWRAVRGRSTRPATGARQHTARPVKDHSSNHGAQRPTRGVGARCHHAARQPTPAPRPARACAASPPGTRRACDRGPPAPRPAWHAIQPSLAARPRGLSCWWAHRGWALTQEPSGITVRTLVRREESRRGVCAGRAGLRTVAGDVPDWRTPKSARRATPGTGRSDTVAYL